MQRTYGKFLKEFTGSRFGDGSKVVDEVILGHTQTGISYMKHVIIFISLMK